MLQELGEFSARLHGCPEHLPFVSDSLFVSVTLSGMDTRTRTGARLKVEQDDRHPERITLVTRTRAVLLDPDDAVQLATDLLLAVRWAKDLTKM